MRRNHANEFANAGLNEFQKQTRNILNHFETLATFDGLDNVLGGSGPGCDVPSAGASLASCYSRTTRIYLDVFRNCFDFCGIKSQGECIRAFRVINRAEDAQLYLDVYQKYSRVSGKVPCVQQDTGVRGSSPLIGGVRDSLDKRKLQPYVSSLCGSSASLPGRSSHANTNAVMITGVNNNGCSASRRGRNVQVHPRLNFEVAVQSPSRRNDRRVLTSSGTVDTNSVASAGTSYTYSDLGDCDCRCRYCRVSFWYVERLKGHSHNWTPEYNLCYGGGRIQMQRPREPPKYIKSLFENKHFMENIRAYNQMFAMTSFEAKVDESINVGRGSYVFKVSGQIYHWIGSLCPPAGERPRFLQLYIYDTDKEVHNRMDHFGGIDNSQLEPGIVEGARGYELPTTNTLGAMVFENGVSDNVDFDVIIQHRDGPPQRLNKLHCSYMSLQFPLLFIYGQAGYQLHFRLHQYDLPFRGGRLFQQYVVGALCAVEQNRLDFIRKKQNDILSDYLSGLYVAISRGERDGYEVVGRIILPMSFTGGPRYMVFEQEIQALIAFLKEERIFGDVTGASRIRIAEDIDRFVSAELPNPRTNPEGYNVVSEPMMHGPYGAASFKASCVKGEKCSKNFMKKFNQKTFFNENGHVHYRRRDTGVSVTRNEFQLDNSYVVPYNRDLILAFRAYINVEYCGWTMLIKYLFKYISKVTDRVFACVSRSIGESSTSATPSRQVIDEIQNYVEGHFICAHEAYWRILKFDIHRREP
uniref:DNA helicase n=1 Tax=Tanacetum cinerariifolium TaxID=118510 RepID=A0A6L2MSZ1_TANCI|nr:DNA helicase [Tanacetum cinerariifolium]